MNRLKLKYLGHIDLLRAIAVLLVILFHLDFRILQGGFIGVDVFFVISGFLITRLISYEYDQNGKVDFKNFYLKRIRRLIPTLFLIIGLTFLLTFLVFSPSDFINATTSMSMSSLALSNFYFLSQSNYFDASSAFKPLLHTWSLGIEEQFYLLYPVTLFFILKIFKTTRKVIIILSIFFTISLLLNVYTSFYGISSFISDTFLEKDRMTSSVSSLQFYLLPFRMFEFLTGAIIVFIPTPKIKSELFKLSLNLFSFILILLSALFFNKQTVFMSTLNFIPCLGVGLLLLFPFSKYLSFLFQNKPIKYIAKISYTLYLVHWLIIVVYRYIFDGEFHILDQLILLFFTFSLSTIIYKYYENPLRYTTARFSIKSNKVLVALLSILILGMYSLSVHVENKKGWLWRLGSSKLKLIEEIGFQKDFHINNWGGAGYQEGWIGKSADESISPDMIWLGDSHSSHYLTGLDSIMVKKNDKNILRGTWFSTLKIPGGFSRSGYDTLTKSCYEKDLNVVIKHSKSPVVISYYWYGQIQMSEKYNKLSQELEKLNQDSTSWKYIADRIVDFHEIIGTDRKLVVFGENPTINPLELNYIEQLMRPKYLASISPRSSTFVNNKIDINTFFQNYFEGKNNINFINPSLAFCEQGVCVKQIDAKIYFSDENHLSQAGSIKAIQYFEKDLLDIINSISLE